MENRPFRPSLPHRTVSALAALAIVGGGMAVLVLGLAAPELQPSHTGSRLVAVYPLRQAPPPEPRREPVKPETKRAKGQASAANLRNKAAQIVAPRPMLPLVIPPPVITATVGATGSARQTGASDRPGSGQGAGGNGSGLGGGGDSAEGAEAGGDDAVTRPRQIKGRLRFSDLPPDLRKAKTGGDLKLRYRIGADGRVSDCRILVSSGRPALDETTCRLITERFRFRPARNRAGLPVPTVMTETHGWLPPPEDDLIQDDQ